MDLVLEDCLSRLQQLRAVISTVEDLLAAGAAGPVARSKLFEAKQLAALGLQVADAVIDDMESCLPS